MSTDGLTIGARFLDQYRVEGLIGAGGMGVVYGAVDEFAERRVALKLIKKPFADRPDYAERFKREMKAVAKLIHPNIVRLYTAGVAERGRLYMIMEYIEGVPLRRLIESSPRVEPLHAIHYALQIGEALVVAHGKGVWHRDIKPDNVLIGEGGHATVLDFGICTADPVRRSGGDKITDEKKMMGTSRYLSPEQIQHKRVDGRVDIYQMGIVFYEMLAGRHPYPWVDEEPDNETGILAAHVHADPTPLVDVVPDCPADLEAIVMKCLAKDPEQRYRQPGDILPDLRALLRDSVPPEHPIARKIAADKAQEAKRRAFASRPSLMSVEGMTTTVGGTGAESAAAGASPRAGGGTAPMARTASRPQITAPIEASFVPVDPLSGKPVSSSRRERTTLPLGVDFAPRSPVSPWARPPEGARGSAVAVTAPLPALPPPSSVNGWAQGSATAPSAPAVAAVVAAPVAVATIAPVAAATAATAATAARHAPPRAPSGLSYAGAGVAVGISVAVICGVLVFGVRPRSQAAERAVAPAASAAGPAASELPMAASGAASVTSAPVAASAPAAASAPVVTTAPVATSAPARTQGSATPPKPSAPRPAAPRRVFTPLFDTPASSGHGRR